MTLSDRERFILHAVSATFTLDSFDNNFNMQTVINFITKNRCRKLSNEDVMDMIKEIKEELLYSKSMWNELDIQPP